jgi:long-chain fatty acid transport protein
LLFSLLGIICIPFTRAIADEFHYINILVGNRAAGLAGAYTALSDDVEGCYYNPAGIALAPYSGLSASVNTFSESNKIYKNALVDTQGRKLDWEQESSSLLPNFFGITRKIEQGMFGLSYAVPDSILRRQKQTFNDIRSQYPDNPIETFTININDSDKTYLFGPSFAYRLSDSLSIGTTLYVYYRDMEIIRNQVLQFDQGQHYWLNYYKTRQEWGLKPIIGAIWEPIDKLALGISLGRIFVTSSDNQQQLIYRDTVGEEPITIDGSTYDFSDTNTLYMQSDSNHDEEKHPLTTSLGLTYFLSPRLLFSGDLVYSEAVSNKEAVLNFAVGCEYYLRDAYAMRVGFYSDYANTPTLKTGRINQPEHIDIYGASFSLTRFQRQSSITVGASYGFGEGKAQVIADQTVIHDVEVKNLSLYVAASYNY